MAVPLILHAISLPLGDDVFWETVNKEFTSPEWEHRLKASECVTVHSFLLFIQFCSVKFP